MIARGKNIYILIIKIKWDFPFVFLWCFWKEKKSFSSSFYLNKNTHQLSTSATSIDPKSLEINTFKTLTCQYFNRIRESVLDIILSTLKKWGTFLQLTHCKWYHQPMSSTTCCDILSRVKNSTFLQTWLHAPSFYQSFNYTS